MDSFEESCEINKVQNDKLIREFESWLKSSGLKEKTIKNHCSNIDFFINDYLLYSQELEPQDGINDVSMFLGFWFIKKAMWSSPASVRSNASSLKKFYTFMLEKGLIDKDELDELKETIKVEMPEWLEGSSSYWN